MDARRVAWDCVQGEVGEELADALEEYGAELREVEAEQDPLMKLQGLIRCKDKKAALATVGKQIEEEAAEQEGLRGGEDGARPTLLLRHASTEWRDAWHLREAHVSKIDTL